MSQWLTIHRGEAPLIISVPHAGTDIPGEIEAKLASPWLARQDADFYVNYLYAFAREMDATMIATGISRTVIDVNRDPGGRSLYPGQATTALCPTTTFDGVPLYARAQEPDEAEIARRRALYFEPYHGAIEAEIGRLKVGHARVVLYDAHSIRSHVPRLFEGTLPVFNIGTNSGASCHERLTKAVRAICETSGSPSVVNARFKGGYISRHYGRPDKGVHAIQMELAMRAYLNEPARPDEHNWPPPYDEGIVALVRPILTRVLESCVAFAKESP